MGSGGREFRVVCRGRGLADYLLTVAGADVHAAADSASAGGHEPVLVFPAGMTHREEHLIVIAWRTNATACPNCGYPLTGLPPSAWIVCPECGLGASAGGIPPPTVSP